MSLIYIIMKTRRALIWEEKQDKKTMAGEVKEAEKVKNSSLSLRNPTCSEENIQWGKSLSEMPTFTIKEIESHRKESGKRHGRPIIKTLDRGKKFKDERYLSADSIFTSLGRNGFFIKAKCKASMKKEVRNVNVTLDKKTGLVVKAACTCPAGNSGYCNHVMALLFELADYCLNRLKTVPEEIACTSKIRQWGIPGENSSHKEAVMKKTVQKQVSKRGISCTLYDPRITDSSKDLPTKMQKMEEALRSKDTRIGYAHCLNRSCIDTVNTKYGEYLVGSTLSFQLLPIEPALMFKSNIEEKQTTCPTVHGFQRLPLNFLNEESRCLPTDWDISDEEQQLLDTLRISEQKSFEIEQETVSQNKCDKWFEYRKNRITASVAHRIFSRKKNFSTLADSLLNPKSSSELPQTVRDALNHGSIYEGVARETYYNFMKYKLKRDVHIRECGLVVQPSLFWLGASPDGLIIDKTDNAGIGLIEIKCPKTKKGSTPQQLLDDKSFYIEMQDGKPVLKKEHANGYYSQIQMAMGLSEASYCDFIVYTFKGLVVIRVPFDDEYFVSLIRKLNMFYKKYFLPKLL